MADNDDPMAKKRGLIGSGVLTRRKCDEWFNYMIRYLKSKSQWWAVDQAEREWRQSAQTNPSTPDSSTASPRTYPRMTPFGSSTYEDVQLR